MAEVTFIETALKKQLKYALDINFTLRKMTSQRYKRAQSNVFSAKAYRK